MTVIAITGGIGSGKSVVSKMLRTMGYDVYDTDLEAKRIMDCSEEIKNGIKNKIDFKAIEYNKINRKRLASIVFNDKEKLRILNTLVHAAVVDDVKKWCDNKRVAFIETALLYESNLYKLVDLIWNVSCPIELRINRVIARNNCTREEVEARIAQQMSERNDTTIPTFTIINDNATPVLPQLENLINQL